MSDRLFDPAEYGVALKSRRSPATCQPTEVVVVVRPPWAVLRHLKGSPRAHLFRNGVNCNLEGGAVATCGAKGIPMRDLAGEEAPACPRCAELDEAS